MFLSIPPGVRVEARAFNALSLVEEGPFVHGRDWGDYFPVGIYKVEEVIIGDPGSKRETPWVVVSSFLQRGKILGQPRSVVEAWANYGAFDLHLGDSVYEKAEQLPLF